MLKSSEVKPNDQVSLAPFQYTYAEEEFFNNPTLSRSMARRFESKLRHSGDGRVSKLAFEYFSRCHARQVFGRELDIFWYFEFRKAFA